MLHVIVWRAGKVLVTAAGLLPTRDELAGTIDLFDCVAVMDSVIVAHDSLGTGPDGSWWTTPAQMQDAIADEMPHLVEPVQAALLC